MNQTDSQFEILVQSKPDFIKIRRNK